MDEAKGFEVDFFADFDSSDMGNTKSSDNQLITGDHDVDMDSQSQSQDHMQTVDNGGLVLSSEEVQDHVHETPFGDDMSVSNVGDIGMNNDVGQKSGSNLVEDHSSLANVESMDTSDLLHVADETVTNMMMAEEDFSDLVVTGEVNSNHDVGVASSAVSQQSQLSNQVDLSTSTLNNLTSNAVQQQQPTPQLSGRTIVMTTSNATNLQQVAASIAKSNSSNQQPIIIPVSSNILSSPSALSDFINSIKPPIVGSGGTGGATIVKAPASSIAQIINLGSASGTNQFTLSPSTGQQQQLRPVKMVTTYSKKQPNIAPAPSSLSSSSTNTISGLQSALNAGSIKIVNTPNGQQILLTSPIKQEGGGTKMVTIPMSSASSSGSNPGQVLFFSSPVKSSSGVTIKPGTSGLKTLAPAPIKVSIASGTGNRIPNTKQVQVVKVVQGTGKGNLRPLAPSVAGAKTIQLTSAQLAQLMAGTSSASGDGSGRITIVPASKASSGQQQQQTIQIGNQQLLLPATSSAGGSSNSQPQVIMLPAHLLQGLSAAGSGGTFTIQSGQLSNSGKGIRIATAQTPSRTPTTYVPIAPSPNTSSNLHPSAKDVLNKLTPTSKDIIVNGKLANTSLISNLVANEEPNRQRKPCNCTKSGCLKLYCDCFAQGEFCNQCNCVNCNNNLDHEEERAKAVKQCIERNPQAFHPKIGKGKITGDTTERRHTKGCNCRRSGCLKNYCECYEGKILCSDLCKCCGCKNFEDSFERKTLQLMNLAEAAEYRSSQANVSKLINWGNDFNTKLPISIQTIAERSNHPVNFITNDIIDAVTNILMATASDGEKRKLDNCAIQANLLAEFGRCLNKIIEWSERSSLNSNGSNNGSNNQVIVGHKR